MGRPQSWLFSIKRVSPVMSLFRPLWLNCASWLTRPPNLLCTFLPLGLCSAWNAFSSLPFSVKSDSLFKARLNAHLLWEALALVPTLPICFCLSEQVSTFYRSTFLLDCELLKDGDWISVICDLFPGVQLRPWHRGDLLNLHLSALDEMNMCTNNPHSTKVNFIKESYPGNWVGELTWSEGRRW